MPRHGFARVVQTIRLPKKSLSFSFSFQYRQIILKFNHTDIVSSYDYKSNGAMVSISWVLRLPPGWMILLATILLSETSYCI